MPTDNYIVLGCRPWSRRAFDEVVRHYRGAWTYIGQREELTLEQLARIAPRYLFFLHWPWIVPEEIVSRYECVGFHMTDVPYGRGGSPLQNLILRGHTRTKLTALRMTAELDAGPVYLKTDLCLAGNAEEIYIRATRLAAQMIERITRERPEPSPQRGEAVPFRRRKPDGSEMAACSSLPALYDFIRMLDAEGYPRAFINHEGFRYEFRNAALRDGRIDADVQITPLEEAKR